MSEVLGDSEDCGLSDDVGFGEGESVFEVCELPSPTARYVIVARFGALEPVEEPIIAYCFPSGISKKGLGSGHSSQQCTS